MTKKRPVYKPRLVGDRKERRRYGEAEHLRSLGVDNQLELRRLHNGQVSRLLALEDAADINARLTVRIGQARRIAVPVGEVGQGWGQWCVYRRGTL
jgi:DNA helicase TIP49 (TBP-interacting protein)